jgi:cytochrome P450
MVALREDPTQITAIADEILRLVSPAQGITRITRRETRLGDFVIPAGAQVMARIGAANRDAAVFPDPDRFDSRRKNVHRHLGFGSGIHTCIGNMLAKKELGIALQELLAQMHDIKIDPTEGLYWPPHMRGRSLASLKLTFKRSPP